MDFEISEKVEQHRAVLETFMNGHLYPPPGIKGARPYVSRVKSVAPQMCHNLSSRAMQAFGGMGVSQDTSIHAIFTSSRYCQIADDPDEVHMAQLGKLTMRGR